MLCPSHPVFHILYPFALFNFFRQRGDGFPLAAMLAAIAVDNKDLVPVLTAHILYVCGSFPFVVCCGCHHFTVLTPSPFSFVFFFSTVCPTAIPKLPTPSADATEEELMESLGMIKGKNGEFEAFERFLSRTEVCRFCAVRFSWPHTICRMRGRLTA
jgi:hypothetical protein